MKVVDNRLYILKLESNNSLISVCNQEGSLKLKFIKNIYLEPSIVPSEDFCLNETKIFLTGFYKNEWNIPNDGNYLFELDHDGLLLQKTKLSLNLLNNFILIDPRTIYFQTKSAQNDDENITKVTFTRDLY